MSIPKIIHQMWLGDMEPPQLWLDTLRSQNPGWEYRLWTDDNLPELKNRAEFDATIDLTQRSDLLRYEILSQHGGVYVDADCICLRPLDDLLVGDFFAGYDNQKEHPNCVANGVIGCSPQHPIMKTCVDYVRPGPKITSGAMVYTTGPVFFSAVLFAYGVFAPQVMESVKIYDERLFYPLRWHRNPSFDFGNMSECYFLHVWGSLHGYDPKLVKRITDLVERGKPAHVLSPSRRISRTLRLRYIKWLASRLGRSLGLAQR